MARRLLNLLTAVSLLLCVAVCVLWVRSYWVGEILRWTWEDFQRREGPTLVSRGGRSVRAARGGVAFYWSQTEPYEYLGGFWEPTGFSRVTFNPTRYPALDTSAPVPGRWLNASLGGFVLVARDVEQTPPYQRGERARTVIAPMWFPAVLFAIVPAARPYRRRRQKLLPGHCSCCGYDLRATPERCPECGTEAAGVG